MGVANWLHEVFTDVREEPSPFALKQAAHTLYLGGVRRLSPLFDDGETFWSDSWDVLVILDACRPDLMREVCAKGDYEWLPQPTSLDTVRSPASSSKGWMEAHFNEDYEAEIARTGYITSNLFIHDFATEQFPVFSEVRADLELADGVRFVEPRRLTDQAIDVWRRRDDLGVDQLIVHYMQPHTPFRSRPEWFTDVRTDTGWGLGFVELRDGHLDPEAFRSAYLDNLEWVLEDIDLLAKNCDADIAVTSDHGNGLGEWGVYGHPNGIPLKVVRDVPWINIRGRDDRSHSPDLPEDYLQQQASVDQSAVTEQLEALGYAD